MARVIDQVLGATTSSVVGEITRELANASDGAGLHFDGAAGSVSFTPVDLGTQFSFEFVVKADELDGGSSKDYLVMYGSGGTFIVGHNDGNLSVFSTGGTEWQSFGANPLSDLKVHHIVVTVDDTSATLYDNGNQIGTATIASPDIDSATAARLLSNDAGTSGHFAATLYRARSYNKALESDEVRTAFERADVDFSSQYGSQTNKFASPDTNWGTNAADATAFNAAYAWTSYQTSTISVSSNVVTFTTAADGRGIFANYSLTAGKRYRVTMATGAISGATYQLMTRTGSDYTSIGTLVASTTNVFDFTAPAGAYSGYLYLYQSGSGSGSIALTAASVTNELVQIGCVSDYDLAYAQPALSTLIQDRSNAADGVASSTGVAQVQPITQLNSTSARIGSTQLAAGTAPYIPADGELLASGNIGSGSADPNINGWGNAITIDNSDTAALEFAKSGTLYGFVGVQGSGSGNAFDVAAYQSQDMRFRVGSNAGTTALTIDSSGTVKVGSAHANEDQTSSLIISKSIASAGTYDYITLADTSNSGSEKLRLLFKGRYDTGSHPNGQEAAYISCDRAGVGDGYGLAFGTGDAADAVDRLTISRTGLCTFSNGIAFGSQTNTSATGAAVDTNGTILEHYEEGTFTYTITGSSTAGTHSGILRQGNYTRVGNICTVMGYYYGTSGTGSGEMIIGGLPFPVKSGASPVGSIQANSGLIIASGSNPTIISAGSSTFKVRCTKEDGSAFTYASYPTDPEYIRFGVTYVI
jgi:hypothetical protein